MLGIVTQRHIDKKKSLAGSGFPIRRLRVLSSDSPPPASPALAAAADRRRGTRKPYEAMHGGRLSAAEKGKQKAADDADLPPAALVLQSAGEPRPAGEDAAANGGGSGSGLPRHLLLRPTSGTSEIEEAPPSPPPGPGPSRLPALKAEDAAAGLAAVAGLESRMRELQAALDSRLRELELLRRPGSEGCKDVEASKRRRDGAAEPEVGGAEVQVLQHHLGAVQEKVSGMKDTVLALRLQAEEMQALEEFWKPVVPPHPQRQRNSSKVH